jgi:radical SAM protein with 4Fe4S-binding SPASM domain
MEGPLNTWKEREMGEFRCYPEYVVWELTCRCNLRCLHCGTAAGNARENELSLDECFALCDELVEMGCARGALSGGEPLLFSGWKRLARRFTGEGVRLSLITNGLLVNERVVTDFEDAGLCVIGISLDGTEDVHNRIRCRPDAFARTLKAIDLIKKRSDLMVTAITQVSGFNISVLDELVQVLTDHGVDIWQPQLTTITGRMREHSDFAIQPKDYLRLARFIARTRETGRMRVDTGENIGYYGPYEDRLRDYPYLGCYAGCRIVGIESNGNIKGCLSLPEDFVEGNIRKRPFREIWEDPEGFAYNRGWCPEKAEGGCKGCEYLTLCRCGCSNTAVGSTGSRFNNPYCLRHLAMEGQIAFEAEPENAAVGAG